MKDNDTAKQELSSSSNEWRGKKVEIVYTPSGIRRNGVAIWRIMLEDLWSNRRLIWLLMLRDISVRYRQSVLGYVWAIVPQLITVGTFAALDVWRVVPLGKTSVPYVVYATWSITVWQLFASSLSACASSLTSAGSLVTKINFPRECLVIAAIGQPMFDFLIRLIPVTMVFIWYGFAPSWCAVFLPVVLCPVVFLALGCGLVLSVANLAIRDTGNALGTVLTIGIFVTPVLYPPPVRWPFTLINYVNPLSPLITASRELLSDGAVTDSAHFVIAYCFAFTLCIGGWRIFRATILRAAVYA